MSFGREKRLWLAALALLTPIPLPFNQVLEWPFLFVYWLFVIHFLRRAERGRWITLPNWVLNVLGLIAMPLAVIDLRAAFLRDSVVTALAHLMMFLMVVKLYSIRREKDKWHLMVANFFLSVGAMATSSHVSIAPYLLAVLILGLVVLGRFAYLHMTGPFGYGESGGPSSPFRAPLALGTLLVVAVAVPLFASMPRIREPYILGRGTGGGMARTTGFSDSVDLSLTSSIRGNRNIAMRVQYDDETRLGNAANLRFKGATFDRYEDRNWFRALRYAELMTPERTDSPGQRFDLATGPAAPEPVNRAEIYLEPIGGSNLPLPVEAIDVDLDLQTTAGRDSGGAVLLPIMLLEPLRYTVNLAAAPVIVAQLDEDPESALSALDTNGLTPRMAELARQVMGGDTGGGSGGDSDAGDSAGNGTAAVESPADDEERAEDEWTDGQRIDRLEQHLLTRYSYTLDFLGRSGESPIEDFLFVYRSGHCELFASAMVLMLRSQGIPARLVTGFLGAELNPIESYYVVRQQNAHAWVEAYTESRGWRIYDPTPPDGRPTVTPQSLKLLISQIYDYFTFRWDRYVLTYGAEDQESFFRKLRERLSRMWSKLEDAVDGEEPEASLDAINVPSADGDSSSPRVWQPRTALPVLSAIFVLAAALLAWNRRRTLDGRAAYLRLRRRLDRSGLEVSESQAPFDLLERAVERFPSAAGDLHHVVGRYVRESFAGRKLDDSERRDLRDALRSVTVEIREARRSHTSPPSSIRRRRGPSKARSRHRDLDQAATPGA